MEDYKKLFDKTIKHYLEKEKIKDGINDDNLKKLDESKNIYKDYYKSLLKVIHNILFKDYYDSDDTLFKINKQFNKKYEDFKKKADDGDDDIDTSKKIDDIDTSKEIDDIDTSKKIDDIDTSKEEIVINNEEEEEDEEDIIRVDEENIKATLILEIEKLRLQLNEIQQKDKEKIKEYVDNIDTLKKELDDNEKKLTDIFREFKEIFSNLEKENDELFSQIFGEFEAKIIGLEDNLKTANEQKANDNKKISDLETEFQLKTAQLLNNLEEIKKKDETHKVEIDEIIKTINGLEDQLKSSNFEQTLEKVRNEINKLKQENSDLKNENSELFNLYEKGIDELSKRLLKANNKIKIKEKRNEIKVLSLQHTIAETNEEINQEVENIIKKIQAENEEKIRNITKTINSSNERDKEILMNEKKRLEKQVEDLSELNENTNKELTAITTELKGILSDNSYLEELSKIQKNLREKEEELKIILSKKQELENKNIADEDEKQQLLINLETNIQQLEIKLTQAKDIIDEYEKKEILSQYQELQNKIKRSEIIELLTNKNDIDFLIRKLEFPDVEAVPDDEKSIEDIKKEIEKLKKEIIEDNVKNKIIIILKLIKENKEIIEELDNIEDKDIKDAIKKYETEYKAKKEAEEAVGEKAKKAVGEKAKKAVGEKAEEEAKEKACEIKLLDDKDNTRIQLSNIFFYLLYGYDIKIDEYNNDYAIKVNDINYNNILIIKKEENINIKEDDNIKCINSKIGTFNPLIYHNNIELNDIEKINKYIYIYQKLDETQIKNLAEYIYNIIIIYLLINNNFKLLNDKSKLLFINNLNTNIKIINSESYINKALFISFINDIINIMSIINISDSDKNTLFNYLVNINNINDKYLIRNFEDTNFKYTNNFLVRNFKGITFDNKKLNIELIRSSYSYTIFKANLLKHDETINNIFYNENSKKCKLYYDEKNSSFSFHYKNHILFFVYNIYVFNKNNFKQNLILISQDNILYDNTLFEICINIIIFNKMIFNIGIILYEYNDSFINIMTMIKKLNVSIKKYDTNFPLIFDDKFDF